MQNLIKADGAFDLSAIMTEAARLARRSRVRFNEWQTVPTYREAFRQALVSVWAQAKRQRAEAMRSPEQIAAYAERASLLFGASMIDSTRRSLAARDAIEARFAA